MIVKTQAVVLNALLSRFEVGAVTIADEVSERLASDDFAKD